MHLILSVIFDTTDLIEMIGELLCSGWFVLFVRICPPGCHGDW